MSQDVSGELLSTRVLGDRFGTEPRRVWFIRLDNE